MGEEGEKPKEKKATIRTFAKEGIEASGPKEKDPRKPPKKE